jgi:hypothetical protein
MNNPSPNNPRTPAASPTIIITFALPGVVTEEQAQRIVAGVRMMSGNTIDDPDRPYEINAWIPLPGVSRENVGLIKAGVDLVWPPSVNEAVPPGGDEALEISPDAFVRIPRITEAEAIQMAKEMPHIKPVTAPS